MNDWRDEIYEAHFEKALTRLRNRKDDDPDFDAEKIRRELEFAYIEQGNDWVGRGEIADISLNASIAATEAFLAGEPNSGQDT